MLLYNTEYVITLACDRLKWFILFRDPEHHTQGYHIFGRFSVVQEPW